MKDVEFYMSLNYPVEIRRFSEEEGGGYLACIPYLGRWMFTAMGETLEDALQALEEVKRDHFERLLAEGKTIPLPPPVGELEEYSGRFVVRIPRHLHRRLAELAQQEGCSLNQYVTTLLAEASAADWLEKRLLHFASDKSGLPPLRAKG
ncbi:hypothetical protein HRbin16_03005 [bacterium HR16]|nr:hypothetical protein HRbin16_03005 [bacterium HR16]